MTELNTGRRRNNSTNSNNSITIIAIIGQTTVERKTLMRINSNGIAVIGGTTTITPIIETEAQSGALVQGVGESEVVDHQDSIVPGRGRDLHNVPIVGPINSTGTGTGPGRLIIAIGELSTINHQLIIIIHLPLIHFCYLIYNKGIFLRENCVSVL